MSKRYLVYKYTFIDQSVYIGRTYEGSGRYNNAAKYVNQEVYKHFQNGYKAEIVYTSYNPFIACYMEYSLIYMHYNNSHNGNTEKDRWMVNAMSELKDQDVETINDYWQEFLKWYRQEEIK